jgi:arabinose-5-phosphate isomerase
MGSVNVLAGAKGNDAAVDVIAVAREVLKVEIAGLEALSRTLDASFERAVDTLFHIEGRIVVSGIGKSGHIARKIAATLSSTGSPALFVHPAEASHGDLGMITPKDALLVISNSGKLAELSVLAPYSRRFKIPMIGMTRDLQSPLAQESDLVLLLPPAEEACPLHLAPTTSTTMTLALGDALAMALLKRRGFSADEFRTLHPGGALGQKLLRVQDLMHVEEALPIVPADATMAEALVCISAKSFGCAGVVDAKGELLGIITDGDLRRHMSGDLLERPASAIMTANPKVIRPTALAAEALGLMNEKSITSLFVVEDSRPVGLIHIHDLLRAGVA